MPRESEWIRPASVLPQLLPRGSGCINHCSLSVPYLLLRSAIYKYDRLEDILSSKPSKKNLELLLLMLVGDMSVDIQKDYQHEYSKIMKRIETKRDELKNNTTL